MIDYDAIHKAHELKDPCYYWACKGCKNDYCKRANCNGCKGGSEGAVKRCPSEQIEFLR